MLLTKRVLILFARNNRGKAWILWFLLLIACQSSTWNGGYAYYPDGADHTSAEFSLWVKIIAAAGSAYVKRSQKMIQLSVRTSEKDVVLERQYTVEAGDLRWYSSWPEVSDLKIIFFEYGDALATDGRDGSPKKVPRQVFSISFAYDESTGSFVDALAPTTVVEQAVRADNLENSRHIIEIYFVDSAESEARILRAIAHLASTHDLKREPPQAGIEGQLAEWSAADFSLHFHRYQSLLGVSLENYGNRDLSQEIAGEILLLPDVARTRHVVSVNFRLGSQRLDSILAVVKAIAERHRLIRMNPEGMFNVATYKAQGLQVSVSHFELDGKVKVLVEDFAWHAEFAMIEEALRTQLSSGDR